MQPFCVLYWPKANSKAFVLVSPPAGRAVFCLKFLAKRAALPCQYGIGSAWKGMQMRSVPSS